MSSCSTATEQPQTVLTTLEPVTIGVELTSHAPLQDVVVGVRIDTLTGEPVWASNTRRNGRTIGRLDGPARVDLSIPSLPLLEGVYDLSVALTDHTEMHPFDHWERRVRFEVRQYRSYDVGLVQSRPSGRSAERRKWCRPASRRQRRAQSVSSTRHDPDSACLECDDVAASAGRAGPVGAGCRSSSRQRSMHTYISAATAPKASGRDLCAFPTWI